MLGEEYDHNEVRCPAMEDIDDYKPAGSFRSCCVCEEHDCDVARAEIQRATEERQLKMPNEHRCIHIELDKCNHMCLYRSGYYIEDIWRPACAHPKGNPRPHNITKDDLVSLFPEWCPLDKKGN